MSECEYAQRLSAYHDGEVPAGERAAIEAHLRQCPACAAEFRRLGALGRLLAAARPEMPPDVLSRLHRATRTMVAADLGRMAKTLMAVAAAILLVCGATLWRSGATGAPAARIPLWETAAVTRQAASASVAEDQLALWIVRDLERDDGDD